MLVALFRVLFADSNDLPKHLDVLAVVKAAGKPGELIVAPDYNHFEMGESLSNPYRPNGRVVLALMYLAPV